MFLSPLAVVLIFSEHVFPSLSSCFLVVIVEVCPPCPGQSASPGGGDFQPEAGHGEEEARCMQSAAQETPNRQVRP
jgi:hypothetical protein